MIKKKMTSSNPTKVEEVLKELEGKICFVDEDEAFLDGVYEGLEIANNLIREEYGVEIRTISKEETKKRFFGDTQKSKISGIAKSKDFAEVKEND